MSDAEPPRFSDLPEPWADRERLAAAAEDCRTVYERLLARLAARLDAEHGTALGVRYWRIVLGPWLLYHLQQLEDRRRRVAAFLAMGRRPQALLDEADWETPRDTPDFLSLFPTERYNLQLMTLCFRAAGIDAPPARAPAGPRYAARPASGLGALKSAARRAAYRAARLVRPPEILTDGVYPLGRRHEELAAACGWRLWPLADVLPERLRVPAVLGERRRALDGLPAEGALEALAVASLPFCLPALFLEGFPAARARAVRALGPAPKVMLHSSGIYYDELYKLCAAEAAIVGARLVGVQHGGQYGTALWSNPEWHERAIADLYLTWGWSEDEATAPVPVPWLSAAPSRAPEAGEVLYVSTSGLKIPHELFPAPLARQYEEFFAWRERFLAALPDEDRDATCARLFPVDCGWNERPRLEARFPGLRFDSGPLKSSVSRAALVVCDHPGTFFLETLAWGVPGVHFWDERLWPSRPAALEALEPLRRAGIVHDSPESAALKITAVRRDPSAWWDEPAAREGRREFVRRYARTDPHWATEWASVLRRAGAN